MNQQDNFTQQGLSVDINDELSKNLTIHKNVNQEIIITTQDKIKLILMETKEHLISQRDWWTPFGLLLSFITTLLTVEFKEAFGISKEFWKAIFVIFTIFSLFWFLKSMYKLIKNWGNDDLDKIIIKMKVKENENKKQ